MLPDAPAASGAGVESLETIMTLKDNLSDWEDLDLSMFYLAQSLGLMSMSVNFSKKPFEYSDCNVFYFISSLISCCLAPSFSMQWGKRVGEIGEHWHYSNGLLQKFHTTKAA